MGVREPTAHPVRVLPTDKGLPAWAAGLPVEDFVKQHPNLSSAGFLFPLLTADGDALEHNIAAMSAYVGQHDALLCPHGKTTMSPQLIRRQLDAGAWGITAATVSQVRAMRAFDVRRVLLANELVDPDGLDWVLAELDRDPGFEFRAYVDSPAGVTAAEAALQRRGSGRPLDLLVELGIAGGRTGCRTVEEGIELASAVRRMPGARLAGVAGYEGVLGHDTRPEAVAEVRAYLGELRRLLTAVADEADGPGMMVTAGGSTWFDLVVEELGAEATAGRAQLVLRSGCYVTHDHGVYAATGPAARQSGAGHSGSGHQARVPQLRPALRLWAQVLSTPEPGLALAGFGRRDCSFDAGLPVALGRLDSDGSLTPVEGVRVVDLNDQHAFLRHAGGLEVGDVLAFGISHPCTTFDKWRLIPVVDGDLRVADCLSTWF